MPLSARVPAERLRRAFDAVDLARYARERARARVGRLFLTTDQWASAAALHQRTTKEAC